MKFSPEQLIQLNCVDFTRIMCPTVLLIASMNGMFLGGMKNPGAYIAKMKKLGMYGGDLDLRLHWVNSDASEEAGFRCPVSGYIELKAGKNTPTDDQQLMMKSLDQIGIPNAWTNSLDGYVNILRRWKVPMRSGYYAGIGKI